MIIKGSPATIALVEDLAKAYALHLLKIADTYVVPDSLAKNAAFSAKETVDALIEALKQ